MNFCSNCGATVTLTLPPGDSKHRYVCHDCDTIHYQNPRIIAGTLPIWQNQVLLCKRAIEPRLGYWTLPAGFMENGETVEAGAARETAEEANAQVADLSLYTVFSLPHISQVYIFFRANLCDLNFSSGEESLDVRLFNEQDIPWAELAFPVIGKTLKYYFKDRIRDTYPVRVKDIHFPRRARSET